MLKRKRLSRTKYQEQLRKKTHKTKLRPWAFWLFIIIFLSLIIFSIYKITIWIIDNKKIEKIDKEVKEEIKIEEITDEGEIINPPVEDKNNDYWNYINYPFHSIDFTTLKETNPDTVAFIHLNNTNINYPVVHTTNNTYYLDHAFNKTKNYAGWIFMDYRNNIEQLSDNTIIYGHGRINGTVFGSLKNVLTNTWQQDKDNYVIQVSTPKENMLFQIFSIYTIESESYYITTRFTNEEEKIKWLNTMKSRNKAPIDTTIDANDKVLTLSTCLNDYGWRIVVHAKLIKRQTR